MYTNVFFVSNLNVIGGVETYLYELAKKYSKYDITICYETGDRKQVSRLRQYVRVIKLQPGQVIKCKRAFINYGFDFSYIDAEEIYNIAHADYRAQGLAPNLDERITKYLGVSQAVVDAYEEISGKKVELCYNPITKEEPKKILKLISATRLTKEKGANRMQVLANRLDEAGIPYIWLVFTNATQEVFSPNVIYMKPKLDIKEYIKEADYLVQLSDTEGWCYSALEALTLGTPIICTPIPSFKEMGVKNGKNGYILPFEMDDIPVDDIYNKIPKFEFKAPNDRYEEILVHEPSTYEKEKYMKVNCKILKDFTDKYTGVEYTAGHEAIFTKERADEILEVGDLIEIISEVEEPKQEVKKPKKK